MELSQETVKGMRWTKSSLSDGLGGACVEVAKMPEGGRAIRDSKDPERGVLVFNSQEWSAFAAGVRAGEFD